MKRAKRQKIYYIPGAIALAVLSTLFIHLANKELHRKSIGVIPLFVADKDLPEKYPEMFKKNKGALFPKRNFTDIFLTGNTKWDKIKLDFARIRIREVLSANDSLNGIHFQFGGNSRYWSFLKAVDILRTEGAKRYVPLDKDLWFFHVPPDTTIKDMACGTSYYATVYNEEEYTPWWSKTLNVVIHVWGSSWEIISAFIAFLMSILAIKRQKTLKLGRQAGTYNR
ncbi:MAG: hypothetical protein INR73_15305 [Williamsia sp.]|nr:hypothetical protein [Williamsia sp.]